MKVRIAKFLSQMSIASRRGAEQMIGQGRISVNGTIIDTPATFVDDTDIVCVDDKPISQKQEAFVYAFHKPINTMTTRSDPAGRKTIYDYLPNEYKNLKYIGRLDYKTTGLLLLTNDGDIARKLTLPSSNVERTYIATTNGNMKNLDLVRNGITVDGIKYRPMKIDIIDKNKIMVKTIEGKKNEIRIVLRACGAPVRELHRIKYGDIELENLGVGKIKKIDKKTIDLMLKKI